VICAVATVAGVFGSTAFVQPISKIIINGRVEFFFIRQQTEIRLFYCKENWLAYEFQELLQGVHRHFFMMNIRTQFYIAISLLALGMVWYILAVQSLGTAPTFPATVNRDCAPWDGSAFTVRIPWNKGDVINVSIWQAPDIKFSATFSFPDDTGQVGNASYQFASGEYEQLSGIVFFWRVDRESPVEGWFKLFAEQGQHFDGQFKAEWENQVILCG
jgi:hypothetical protein